MDKNITIRNLKEEDYSLLRVLVEECQPLLINPAYINIFLAKYFTDTCFILEKDNQPAGFITALKSSAKPGVLFIWQIGIAKNFRGQKLSLELAKHAAEAAKMLSCTELQFSISPDLDASFSLFSSLAETLNSKLEKIEDHKYEDPISGKTGHEVFYRIAL